MSHFECICPVAGYCERYKRTMPEPHWRICQGQTTKLTPEQCEAYRQLWLSKAGTPKPPRPKKEPVGDELAKIFEWLGQVKSGSCKCKKLQNKMNRWGVDGCRTNYALILDKLERAAFERNLPLPRLAFVPFLELAISRASKPLEKPLE